jgi:acyl dehydratase
MRVTLQELVGLGEVDLGVSGPVLVTQERIDAFGYATEDLQWVHVDPERAANGPFGTTIAHGYLTLSLVSNVLLGLLDVTDANAAINYGLDRVRFPAPVRVGSQVRGTGRLLTATEVAGGVQTSTRVTMLVEGVDRPVCVADVLTRFYA